MSARREAIAGATILAVDDNPDNLELVRQILEGQHEVIGALDGAEALAVARARQPDVILLDLLMPGMDGYKVLERLKADPATRAIPVLIFTARYRDIDHVVHGLELGALDYVTKPVDEELLRARVSVALRVRRCAAVLRSLAAALEAMHERDRAVHAKALHDDLGQMLAGLRIDLGWLAGRLPEGGDEVHERLQAMASLVDQSIDSVRHIASSLRPAVLDDLGLGAAVEWMTREFEQRSGIRCALVLAEGASTGSAECDTTVFRIFEEALTNVARHARAGRVWVRLECSEEALELEVLDDGAGIDTEVLHRPRSVGLTAMRERAAGWGGELVVEPGAAGGTVVRLRMPLAEKSNA